MKKVLLITDVDFWKKGAGHRVRISALVNHLARYTHLTVAYLGMVPPAELGLVKSDDASILILDNENILSPSGYGEKLTALLDGDSPDVAIIEYIHLSYMLNFVEEDVKMILDMHDIISERTEAFGEFNYSGAVPEMLATDEFAIMEVYDKVMVLCQPDREKLEQVIPGHVLLCPHPAAVHQGQTRAAAGKIVYMASEYLPNVDAIVHYLETAWPIISAEHAVELHIFGNVCHALASANLPANVVLRGYAADIRDIYNEADIMINPVRFGAGMKIKTLEALAAGIPLLSTSHGARGLDHIAGKAFLIADTPEEFAKQTGRLIEDLSLREEMSKYATDYMTRYFGADQCFKPLLDTINSY
jgi:hypothetical protein